MAATPAAYRRFRCDLPVEAEEDAVAWLWAAGTLGLEERSRAAGRVVVVAWFSGEHQPAAEPLRALAGLGAALAEEAPVAETDWLAAYRALATPFPVGRRLVVDPREPNAADTVAGPREPSPAAPLAPGVRLLRLPARTAFGTGSHESSRLAVELLDDLELGGARVLDVGCGTGILAFAALTGGAARAVAFDLDLEAALLAGENAHLNQMPGIAIFAGGAGALAPPISGGHFDLVVANVIPEELEADLAAVLAQAAPGGTVALSGILAERGDAVEERLAAAGWRLAASRRDGEWVALRFVAAEPPK